MAKRRLPSKKAAAKRIGITPAEARAYIARWTRVNAHVAAERRTMTPQQRFDELVRLMQWPAQLRLRNSPEPDNREIWERWNKLREALRG